MRDYTYVELFFDTEQQVIGLRLVNETDTGYKLSTNYMVAQYGFINAVAFFKRYELCDHYGAYKYEKVDDDKFGQLITIKLNGI